MSLTSADCRAVLKAVDGFYSARTRAEFCLASREGLEAVVPADIHDIVILATQAPEEDLYFGSPHGYTSEEKKLMVEHVGQHPVVAHFMRAGDCGAMLISQFLPLREWRERDYYVFGNRRLRQDFEVVAMLPGATETGMGGVAVSRSGRDFSARDREAVDMLRRHLGRAWGRMLRDERAAARKAAPLCPAALGRALRVLSGREVEVLVWVCEGKRDGEIAAILGLSPLTVTTHVRNLLQKLAVESRGAAAARAMRAVAEF